MKYLLYALILFVSLGCKSTRPISEITIRSDTTIIREKTVIVEVPGATVKAEIDYSRIARLFKGNKIIIREDPKGIARLTLSFDSINQILVARCEALERQQEVLVQEIERITTINTKVILEEQKGFFSEMGDFITKALWIIGIVLLLNLLVPIVIRMVKP